MALAVFPSTTSAQRPAAVALVGEDDWQGAIAASVLMAAPVKAPVLISAQGGVPGPTSTALAALAPRGSDATGGAQAFVIGDVARPAGMAKVTAVKGSAASIAAAIEALRDKLLGAAPEHVVIASSRTARVRHAGGILGGAIRRSGPLHRPRQAAGADRGGVEAAPEDARLRARALCRDLPRT